MPKFLEEKLKKEYGAKSDIPYKVMNKLGYMHGNKETSKGKTAEKKHEMAKKIHTGYKGHKYHEPKHGVYKMK